ncbi:MAG TPA: GNAT family N-acetyltransferase, partial [Actinomycetota bacterium]|nr:GNAT family N-acetyltransferase [Actinomycetota bacterium]
MSVEGARTRSGVSFRRALPSEASAIAALVNSAYRGDSSRVGWT